MSDTGKQSPLGVNLNSSILQDIGFNINPVAAAHFGVSKVNSNYSFGSLVQNTCLRLLTWSIHDGYNRGVLTLPTTYNNIITIGQGSIPALGNSKPTTYVVFDPAGRWKGAATTGYFIAGNTGQGQSATWFPYLYDNGQPNHSVTQWGFIRCWALQAWNEYNWNGIPEMPTPEYKDFTSSVLTGSSFINYSNVAINSFKAGQTFLKGTYSTMDNLISADITGVSLATSTFGQDCITAGKIIDLSRISTFGLPSTLLQTIKKYNSMTPALVLAMIASGLSQTDVDEISKGTASYISIQQEQQIYGGFNIILGQDLQNILLPLNCKTSGIASLADLLDVKKIFPNSYASLTVPVYNTSGVGPAKIAYFIFSGAAVNSTITSSTVSTQIGTFVPAGTPPIVPASVAASTTFADPVTGFGSYLDGILPKNIAVTAGAFSAAMQQIRNIQSGEFEKFAQVAYSIETTKDLPLTAGTDVPASTTFATKGHYLTAIGSGPVGTFTMSDILGCMSAVPYAWSDLQTRILNLQTIKLANIYQQNFLAVTWEKAKIDITQPYWYTIPIPYIPPTESPNPPNPAHYLPQTIEVPVYGTALDLSGNPIQTGTSTEPNPDYSPVPYLNGSTGAETYCPSYYSAPGRKEEYDWYYSITLGLGNDGGGYGRGTAVNPLVTITPNNVSASATVSIGRNDQDARSMGGGTFGRVSGTTFNPGGSYKWAHTVQDNWRNVTGQDTCGNPPPNPIYPPKSFAWVQANIPFEKISIQHAPVGTLAVQSGGAVATNGVNSTGDVFADPVLVGNGTGLISAGEQGWSNPMNTNVQAYATQANVEISRIKTASPAASTGLNTVYDAAGTQLMIEQRARWYAIPPVPAPVRDVWLNLFPTALYVFTDSMPDLALRTEPHMEAQNIEGITATNTTGGQSAIAMMRQDRNKQRLTELGVELDDNIAGKVDNRVAILNIANGTTSTATLDGGIPVTTAVVANTGTTGTNPAGTTSTPIAYTIPANLVLLTDNQLVSPVPTGYWDPNTEEFKVTTTSTNNGVTNIGEVSSIGQIINKTESSGIADTIPIIVTGSRIPTGAGVPIDTGKASEPGSLAGSPYTNLLPITLNTTYTSGVLSPSTYSVAEAIEKVITCNCDCWVK